MSKLRVLLCLVTSSLITGCITFDQKSESVTFHQLSGPVTTPTIKAPIIFIPRANIPVSIRRPTLVIADETRVIKVDDSQRWIASLDRAVSEIVGRNLTKQTGLPFELHTPSENYLVLFIDVEAMFLTAQATVLQLHYRFEDAQGKTLSQGHGQWKAKRSENPIDYVNAQSENFAKAAAQIAQDLKPLIEIKNP
ncbi:MAG: membrane integrity-associated transporter subunit PqiC [Opitutales bacterium]|nr:membrane integrity-associated transporter subunit PqiC [Opitutales bacterium]